MFIVGLFKTLMVLTTQVQPFITVILIMIISVVKLITHSEYLFGMGRKTAWQANNFNLKRFKSTH